MNAPDAIVAAISLGVLVYLLWALINPERL